MESFLNNKFYVFLFVFIGFTGCKNEEEKVEETKPEKEELIMYQPSEMASFMNAMYVNNLQIKAQIEKGEVPVSMPLDLMTLHSAEMTKGNKRTAAWNNVVNVFIESQKAVLDTLSNIELKERYNSSINNCLQCHKTECTGPIPKIKKLLIK
ncbi:MAG: hypothetical protein Wins2KO_29640 [Winogradskyella sp.]